MSITKRPHEIHMNGTTFQIEEPVQKKKKMKLPKMYVAIKEGL